MSHLENLKLLDKKKEEISNTDTVKEMFKKHNVDLDLLNHIPVYFDDLDVSARTEKGIIILNSVLLEKPEDINSYLVHELQHVLDQCWGNGPTEGATEDNYLDNKFEIEGFQEQSKYISETEGDEEAEEYIDKVLLHHEIEGKERDKRKKQLLQLAMLSFGRNRIP